MEGGGGVRGHILNCGKTATNTCIIMLRLSLANPGNSASKTYSTIYCDSKCCSLQENCTDWCKTFHFGEINRTNDCFILLYS